MRRAGRRGQILFLEFMITLPIFALLIIAMTVFHIHYLHTATQHGLARNAAWIKSQDIISRKATKPSYRQERYQFRGDQPTDSPIPINEPVGTQFDLAISTKLYRSPSWLGTGEAVGRVEMTQDPWANEEMQVKGMRLLRTNTPFPMPVTEPRFESKKGQKEPVAKAYAKAQYEFLEGREPPGPNREFTVEPAAMLFYGQQFNGREKAFLGL